MNFSNILYKDKTDIKGYEKYFPSMVIKGTMESMKDVDFDAIDTLCVKTTKVGTNTLKKMRNLKTVILRAHGTDTIDTKALKENNIRLIVTHPTKIECASWIVDKLNRIPSRNILYIGYGEIAKTVKKYGFSGNIKTSRNYFNNRILRTANTLVFSAPLTGQTKGMVNAEFLKQFVRKINIVSISRAELFNFDDIIKLRNKIKQGHFDIIDKSNRDNMIAHGFFYYNHSAWNFNFSQKRFIKHIYAVLKEYRKD